MISKIFGVACLAAVAAAKNGKGKGLICKAFEECRNSLFTLETELAQCVAYCEDVADEVADLVYLLRDQYYDRTGLSMSSKDWKMMLRAEFDAQYTTPSRTPVDFMVTYEDMDDGCDGSEAPVLQGVADWQACEDMTEDLVAYRDWLDDRANPTRYAITTITSTDESVTGTVTFEQKRGQPTRIVADIAGLAVNDPGTDFEGQHGFHIHTYGAEISCGAAGGHYNPFGVTHGAPDDDVRHVGDLGNITAETDGGSTRAQLDITSEQVTLFGDDSILGRAIVIHASYDRLDIGDGDISYSGSSGSRVACGTIGLTSQPAP